MFWLWSRRRTHLETLESRLIALQSSILRMERQIMAKFDDLVAKVAELKTVEDSAVALITGLRESLDHLKSGASAEQIQSVMDQIDAQTGPLAAAVAANTAPPAPEPAPEPAPAPEA